jgi:cell fate regulator YaaT (PSP1 superfamily)
LADIFENDIDAFTNEDLTALEDSAGEEIIQSSENFVFPDPLYRLRLDYSCEGLYAVVSDNSELHAGDGVIIPTRYGKDLARVLGLAKKPIGIKPQDVVTVDRKATPSDMKRAESLKVKEKEAFHVFQQKTAMHGLDMKLIATHYLLDEPKVLFFFTADNRVDFRELVKDLVSVFRMRIELRQIGVRDESRITGGLGVCGRPFCCHAVSDKLRPVSIRMAKDQNLSLNSMKISGQCGRLLCCLSYEFDWYAEARKNMPQEGIRLHYDGAAFRVTSINPISSMVQMAGEDGRILEIPSSRFALTNGMWNIR